LAYVSRAGSNAVLRGADGSVLPAPVSYYDYTSTSRTQVWLLLPWPGDITRLAAIRRQFDLLLQDNDWTSLAVAPIDLTANGGLGAVTAPPVVLDDSLAHKLTAVPHANGEDYWIICQQRASDAFIVYRLGPSGVDPVPVISHVGAVLPESVGGFPLNPMIHGNLVANYAGDALASVSFSASPAWPDTSITELFHFDDATGEVTFWMSLPSDRSFMGEGGAEFSPDGTKLYVAEVPYIPTSNVRLVQYDLTDPAPMAVLGSETLIQETLGPPDVIITAMPIAAAPDGRIYIGKGPSQYLAVIEHPDSAGLACGLQSNGLFLSSADSWNFVPNTCKRYHDSEMTVGVKEVPKASGAWQVWPVPAEEVLNVSVPERGRLAVLDMLGREVAWQRADVQGTLGLEVAGLAPGTYLLRFASDHGVVLTGTFLKE
jgi:hypothetical protein